MKPSTSPYSGPGQQRTAPRPGTATAANARRGPGVPASSGFSTRSGAAPAPAGVHDGLRSSAVPLRSTAGGSHAERAGIVPAASAPSFGTQQRPRTAGAAPSQRPGVSAAGGPPSRVPGASPSRTVSSASLHGVAHSQHSRGPATPQHQNQPQNQHGSQGHPQPMSSVAAASGGRGTPAWGTTSAERSGPSHPSVHQQQQQAAGHHLSQAPPHLHSMSAPSRCPQTAHGVDGRQRSPVPQNPAQASTPTGAQLSSAKGTATPPSSKGQASVGNLHHAFSFSGTHHAASASLHGVSSHVRVAIRIRPPNDQDQDVRAAKETVAQNPTPAGLHSSAAPSLSANASFVGSFVDFGSQDLNDAIAKAIVARRGERVSDGTHAVGGGAHHPSISGSLGVSAARHATSTVEVDAGDGRRARSFPFDNVITGPQQELFDSIGRPMITEAFEGFNVCLFAYGQTGSGKTYSIQGPSASSPIQQPSSSAAVMPPPAPSAPLTPSVTPGGGGSTPPPLASTADSGRAGHHGASLSAKKTGSSRGVGGAGNATGTKSNASLAAAAKPSEGVLPRIVRALFAEAQRRVEEDSDLTVRVNMSYLEVYNEHVRDLLAPRPAKGQEVESLEIVESGGGMATMVPGGRVRGRKVYVKGLGVHSVLGPERVWELLARGNANRQTAETRMNELSSRSHGIVQLTVSQIHESLDRRDLESVITIVDLAGSERQEKTESTGQQFVEAKNINQSLLSLGRALHAASEKERRGDPSAAAAATGALRESKLTRLLADSFGGNDRTWMLATIAPTRYNLTETMSTLEYATYAKAITNRATVNSIAPRQEVAHLREQEQKLQLTIEAQRKALETKRQKESKLKKLKQQLVERLQASYGTEVEERLLRAIESADAARAKLRAIRNEEFALVTASIDAPEFGDSLFPTPTAAAVGSVRTPGSAAGPSQSRGAPSLPRRSVSQSSHAADVNDARNSLSRNVSSGNLLHTATPSNHLNAGLNQFRAGSEAGGVEGSSNPFNGAVRCYTSSAVVSLKKVIGNRFQHLTVELPTDTDGVVRPTLTLRATRVDIFRKPPADSVSSATHADGTPDTETTQDHGGDDVEWGDEARGKQTIVDLRISEVRNIPARCRRGVKVGLALVGQQQQGIIMSELLPTAGGFTNAQNDRSAGAQSREAVMAMHPDSAQAVRTSANTHERDSIRSRTVERGSPVTSPHEDAPSAPSAAPDGQQEAVVAAGPLRAGGPLSQPSARAAAAQKELHVESEALDFERRFVFDAAPTAVSEFLQRDVVVVSLSGFC